MGLAHIAVRVVVVYLYLMVVTRTNGKGVVSQATPFDFVLAMILGDLIDDALWAEVPISRFAAAAGALVVCDLLTKLGSFYSKRFHILVEGTPSKVMRHGREDGDALRQEQLSDDDLAHLLRLRGIEKRKNVHVAFVESDHQLSVVRTPESQPATRADTRRVKELIK